MHSLDVMSELNNTCHSKITLSLLSSLPHLLTPTEPFAGWLLKTLFTTTELPKECGLGSISPVLVPEDKLKTVFFFIIIITIQIHSHWKFHLVQYTWLKLNLLCFYWTLLQRFHPPNAVNPKVFKVGIYCQPELRGNTDKTMRCIYFVAISSNEKHVAACVMGVFYLLLYKVKWLELIFETDHTLNVVWQGRFRVCSD